MTGFEDEENYIHSLLEQFESRIPNAAVFAMNHRTLLLRAKSGVGLDIALGGMPFEEASVERLSMFEFPGGAALRTCSAEDLIVMKSFANRSKDWMDVEGIILRQMGKLDWNYIRRELGPLAELKEKPEIMSDLEKRKMELEG